MLPFAGAYMNVAPLTFQFPHTGDFTCQSLQITGFAVIIPVFQFIIQQAGIPCIIFNIQIMNPAPLNGNIRCVTQQIHTLQIGFMHINGTVGHISIQLFAAALIKGRIHTFTRHSNFIITPFWQQHPHGQLVLIPAAVCVGGNRVTIQFQSQPSVLV